MALAALGASESVMTGAYFLRLCSHERLRKRPRPEIKMHKKELRTYAEFFFYQYTTSSGGLQMEHAVFPALMAAISVTRGVVS